MSDDQFVPHGTVTVFGADKERRHNRKQYRYEKSIDKASGIDCPDLAVFQIIKIMNEWEPGSGQKHEGTGNQKHFIAEKT